MTPQLLDLEDQSKLDITDKNRANLLKWTAQFSPQLIEHLIQKYAQKGDKILDPFLGSGTVLYEAGRLGYEASGGEVNPAAVYLSNIYRLINYSLPERQKAQQHTEKFIDKLSKSGGVADYGELASSINRFAKLGGETQKIVFYAFITLLDIKKDKPTEVDKLVRVWQKLQGIISELPLSPNTINIFHSDARNLPLREDAVNLVITSPPYINVLNYHQQYRHSVELLGWDLLEVAKSEIGSNRKNRGNRFLTVISYCQEIAQSLEEIKRVSRKNARIIFVIGRQSTVRSIPFKNGAIVKEVAVKCAGLRLVKEQERKFRNRFGEIIYEDILHFENTKAARFTGAALEKVIFGVFDERIKTAQSLGLSEDIVAQLKIAQVRAKDLEPSVFFDKGKNEPIIHTPRRQAKSITAKH